jgi:stage III sporulation protein AC
MEEKQMNVDLIFKIAAVGILIAVINIVLQKAGREEMAMMTTLAGIVIVLLMVINLINQLFQNIKSIFKLY